MQKEGMLSFWATCTGTKKDRKNMRAYGLAMGVWAVCLIGGLFALKLDWVPAGPAQWVVGGLPLVTGLFVMVPFAKFLRENDELQRKIQLEALALGFGGGFFSLMGYAVLENVGAPALDLGDAPMVLMAFYMLGLFLGWRRYR